ncbi:MAG: 6-carboxytetrahydropterin synthase [Gammaproteobacteria bacterium]
MACLFVEQLTVLDFSRLDRERGLVGESWIVDLELSGDLDEQSMVLDFGAVKQLARAAVEDYADHKLLVPTRCGWLEISVSTATGELNIEAPAAGLRLRSPGIAVCCLDTAQVTMPALTVELEASVAAVMPANVSQVRVSLREESLPGAYYHYSHGLKRHAGNCQRIAHGHRSRIEIYTGGRRNDHWERYWAERWRDIYLGSEEDLVAETRLGDRRALRFGYHARQGEFELELWRDRCELVPADTTVEQLAAYIAAELHRMDPGTAFRVRAYEGVQKGAIAENYVA